MSEVIDAKARFSQRDDKGRGERQDERDERRASLLAERSKEVLHLRKVLESKKRIDRADREIIARNIGREIERDDSQKPTQTAALLFRKIYGEEGGASREKKRKRYILFSKDKSGGECAANGSDYLQLIVGLADLRSVDEDSMLRTVCSGTSFETVKGPKITEGKTALGELGGILDELISRIQRDTDFEAYLDDVQKYGISLHAPISAGSYDGMRQSPIPPIERFGYNPSFPPLRLDSGVGSFLLPVVQLARVYWPRRVLCLPVFVPAKEVAPLLSVAAGHEENSQREYDLWCRALEKAGLNVDTMNWHSFEDPSDRSPLQGAEWRTFWQPMNVDMQLIANAASNNLHFAVFFGNSISGEDSSIFPDLGLLRPSDDDNPMARFDCFSQCDEIPPLSVPWVPTEDGERYQVCRGFQHNFEWEYGDVVPQAFDDLELSSPLRIGDKAAWDIFEKPMIDWKSIDTVSDQFSSDEEEPTSLRPLFHAPPGFTSARDNSLAAAILRNFAYAEGDQRLDNQVISKVNHLIQCFNDMKEKPSSDFQTALSAHGYGNKKEED